MRLILSAFVCLSTALSAQTAHARARASTQGQQHILSGEARVGRDSKVVNFGEDAIGATAKSPAVSEISSSKTGKDHDFVKIRLRWHPEMVASAANID